MSTEAIIITVLASLLSGLIGSAATIVFMGRLETRKLKADTLRRLLGNRDDLTGAEFCAAANEVLVVFRDCPRVLSAIRILHQVASTPGKPNIDEALIVLLKEAAAACGLAPEDVPDTAFLQVINRRPK
jgi:hypothetical protein